MWDIPIKISEEEIIIKRINNKNVGGVQRRP